MKRNFAILFFIVAILVSCASKSQVVSTHLPETKTKAPKRLSLQDSIINFGMNYLRTPYRYGGTTPAGFDCSGFTSYVYKNFGYSLSRSSRDQAKQFPTVAKKEVQTGDLVFFEGRRHNGSVGHVGIVKEAKPNGEFNFLHASVNKGVIVSSSHEPYYASRYVKAGRIVNKGSYPSLSRQGNFPVNSQKNDKKYVQKNEHTATLKETYSTVYHIVKSGETLVEISKKYDVPISSILHLNGLKSKKIKRGQRLLIGETISMPEIPVMEISSILAEEFITPPKKEETQKMSSDNQPKQIAKSELKILEITPVKLSPNNSQSNLREVLVQKSPQDKNVITTTELKIPKKESANKIQPQVSRTHKTTEGETLFGIARTYNLSVEEIKRLNNMNNNSINIGQVLLVR